MHTCTRTHRAYINTTPSPLSRGPGRTECRLGTRAALRVPLFSISTYHTCTHLLATLGCPRRGQLTRQQGPSTPLWNQRNLHGMRRELSWEAACQSRSAGSQAGPSTLQTLGRAVTDGWQLTTITGEVVSIGARASHPWLLWVSRNDTPAPPSPIPPAHTFFLLCPIRKEELSP